MKHRSREIAPSFYSTSHENPISGTAMIVGGLAVVAAGGLIWYALSQSKDTASPAPSPPASSNPQPGTINVPTQVIHGHRYHVISTEPWNDSFQPLLALSSDELKRKVQNGLDTDYPGEALVVSGSVSRVGGMFKVDGIVDIYGATEAVPGITDEFRQKVAQGGASLVVTDMGVSPAGIAGPGPALPIARARDFHTVIGRLGVGPARKREVVRYSGSFQRKL